MLQVGEWSIATGLQIKKRVVGHSDDDDDDGAPCLLTPIVDSGIVGVDWKREREREGEGGVTERNGREGDRTRDRGWAERQGTEILKRDSMGSSVPAQTP